MMTRKQGSMNVQILSGKPAQSQGIKVLTGLHLGTNRLKDDCEICQSNCHEMEPGVIYYRTLPDGKVVQDSYTICLSECDIIC